MINLDIDRPEEITQALYNLYESDPSSENLVEIGIFSIED
jgi:hypothetical protein